MDNNNDAPRTVLLARSNPVAPDPRVERVATTLAEGGNRILLIAWDRSASAKVVEHRPYGLVTHYRNRASYGIGIRNLPSLVRWQMVLLRQFQQVRRKLHVIHACDFDTVLPALVAKKVWGKKVIYDNFDFYADHLRDTPGIVKELIRLVDLWAMGQADAVILADDARHEQIRGGRPKRIEVIYNTPEDVLLSLQETGSKSGDEERAFRIAFVGLMYVERGLLELLEVLQRHIEWKLDLAGFGGDAKDILPKAETLNNVHFHGRIPHERALELMYAADALIATYDPRIPNHRYASPNKLFEAMMLAKPIVVARGTNMDRIVEEHGCGLVVPYGDVPALEEALAKLASDPALRARLGAAGRRAYDSTYSWDIMSRRLLELYDQL